MARNTSTSATKTLSNTTMRLISKISVLLAALMIIASGWAWWHYIHNNPKRVFDAMLSNSLKSTGVTHSVEQVSGDQKLQQTVQYMTTPYQVVHANTVLSQGGENEASVVTETIGTPFIDYVRYLDVVTKQNGSNGKPLDFSKLIGVWGKTSSTVEGEPTQTNGELFNETILGVVPMVNLPANARTRLLKQIHTASVYTPDYSSVERRIRNGRPEYIYKVSVKAEPYVGMLKELAHEVGLTQLEQVDPANYAGSEPLQFTIGVDVWTRQLTSINFTSTADRNEQFSSYGLRRPVEYPGQTVSVDELQSRLQSIQ